MARKSIDRLSERVEASAYQVWTCFPFEGWVLHGDHSNKAEAVATARSLSAHGTTAVVHVARVVMAAFGREKEASRG